MTINVISTVVVNNKNFVVGNFKNINTKEIISIIIPLVYLVCIMVFFRNIHSDNVYFIGFIKSYLHPFLVVPFYSVIFTSKLVTVMLIYYNKQALYPNNRVLTKALFFSYVGVSLITIAIISPMFFFSLSFPMYIMMFVIVQTIYMWKSKYKTTILCIVTAIIFAMTSSYSVEIVVGILNFVNLFIPDSDSINSENLPSMKNGVPSTDSLHNNNPLIANVISFFEKFKFSIVYADPLGDTDPNESTGNISTNNAESSNTNTSAPSNNSGGVDNNGSTSNNTNNNTNDNSDPLRGTRANSPIGRTIGGIILGPIGAETTGRELGDNAGEAIREGIKAILEEKISIEDRDARGSSPSNYDRYDLASVRNEFEKNHQPH